MEFVFSFFWVGYLLLLGACWYTWGKLKPECSELIAWPSVSVVVAMRNEETNLFRLVNALAAQDYPPDKLQVIFVDDASEDGSLALLSKLTAVSPLDITVIPLDELSGFQGSYKKRALTTGIAQATGKFIVTTDADCTFDPSWLRMLMSHMIHKQAYLVSAPVAFMPATMTGGALVDQEFAALIATGASFLHWGYPNMCNGANLAFSKEAFIAVNGYAGYEQVISGDDEFLLYKISQRFPQRVTFLKHRQALVRTEAPNSWTLFLSQRKRWSGKWKHHKSWFTKGLALFIFVFHTLWLTSFLLTLMGGYSSFLFVGQLLGKLAFEALLLISVLRFQFKKLHPWWFMAGQILYSCYAVFFGIFANFGRYSWKNRTFK